MSDSHHFSMSQRSTQSSISAYFSQQPSASPSKLSKTSRAAPIDLTLDSDEDTSAPPAKRQKTSGGSFDRKASSSRPRQVATPPPKRTGQAEQWRFDPASPTKERSAVPDGTPSSDVEEGGEQEDADGDGEAEADRKFGKDSDQEECWAQSAAKTKSQKAEELGPSGKPWTPFELQVRELKAKHPGTVLMIQSGYKMLFFEEDAKIASKELGMVCFPKRNLLTSMIQSTDATATRLASWNNGDGSAQEGGDSRNELFAREVTRLYTAATFVDNLSTLDELDPNNAPPLMCLLEEPQGGMGTDERFEDNHMRTELETRMVHTKPYELLLPTKGLSPATEKMIKHFTEHSHMEHRIRIERFRKQMAYSDAFALLSKFYTEKHADASESFKKGDLMAAVAAFSKLVVIALGQSLKYLKTFNVADALRETRFFAKFTERTHMLLNANTLTNLEIYRNDTDYTTTGSLMWILDRTSTRFGARLLRSWVGKPLVDPNALRERTDAVDEILANRSPKLTQLREVLRRLPDLARGLCRIQYGKCTPQELATLLKAFRRVASAFAPATRASRRRGAHGPKASLLVRALEALPRLKGPVEELCAAVRFDAAAEGKEDQMWTDPDRYPDLDEETTWIQVAESELKDELSGIRKVLKKPALQYTTWMTEEYVIEVRKDAKHDIPPDWTLLSSTKYVRRYHTPNVRVKLQERAQHKEALALAARRAFRAFLAEIADEHYALLRDAANQLAVVDCLFSLAQVAAQEGYCRPTFVEPEDADVLEIVNGRHPMVEAVRADPFVPNSVRMGAGHARHLIVTGPNMGGKSSVVRMAALCAIMAQVGSYVPADSMRLSLLDGVLTRMGASDELSRGRSTFMVEMQETSDILRIASPRTLVVLDELGRGTSTFDGMAIAGAVLQHLVQTAKCKTLFITHYPQVATDLARAFPAAVGNVHMGFTETARLNGTRDVTFLYRLTPGLVRESFGVECARLAGLPEGVLAVAADKAAGMKAVVEERIRRTK
ncbi:muts domain V-domain-containing protein [Epithele typhae]|uniref:muts domain V-domain-containing protein n=1 Tax=Epithele typhae TaxID=378194 RepID=UPI00200811AC|nr:muts domain V-domain-containing protein [Epithele typhae]KAH9923928.1 muts domain V-domain-containing protein [Epithele typhae]